MGMMLNETLVKFEQALKVHQLHDYILALNTSHEIHQAYEKEVEQAIAEDGKLKNWHFPKAHMHVHVPNNLRNKGVSLIHLWRQSAVLAAYRIEDTMSYAGEGERAMPADAAAGGSSVGSYCGP